MNNIEDFLEKIKKYEKKKKKKYHWNDAIQSQDKSNGVNFERRNFNPSIIINSKKRIGINKKRAYFSSDDSFNGFNC